MRWVYRILKRRRDRVRAYGREIRKRYEKDRDSALTVLFREGFSVRKIARVLALSPSAVGRLRKKLLGGDATQKLASQEEAAQAHETDNFVETGVPLAPLSADHLEHRVRVLLDAGKELDAIARELNVSLMFVKVMARIRSATAGR